MSSMYCSLACLGEEQHSLVWSLYTATSHKLCFSDALLHVLLSLPSGSYSTRCSAAFGTLIPVPLSLDLHIWLLLCTCAYSCVLTSAHSNAHNLTSAGGRLSLMCL